MDATELQPTPAPPPPPRRRRRWLLGSGIGLGAVLLAFVIAAAWFFATTAGARFVLATAGLKAIELEGTLLGPLKARSLVFERPKLSVILDNVVFDWKPLGLLGGTLHLTDLSADSLVVATTPSKEKNVIPESLKLRLPIRIDKAHLKKVALANLGEGGRFTPTFEVTDFSLASAASGDLWRFESAGAMTAAGRLDLKGSIGASRPFPVEVAAKLSGTREGRTYRLEGTALGELAKFDVAVRGTEGGITGDAVATVTPFDDTLLRRLKGKLSGIDVRAFMPQSPHTLLTVEADLVGHKDKSLSGPVAIVNAQPGAIDEARIPVTHASGRLLIAAPRYELTQASIGFTGGGVASGDVRIEGARAEVKVAVKGLDLRRWYGTLQPTQLAGDISANSQAGVQAFVVDLKDPRFAIAGKARIADKVLTIEQARVARGAAAAALQGTLSLTGRREFDVKGELDHADPSAFAAAPAGELNGKFTARGTLEGGVAGELRMDLADSRIAGLAVSGRAVVTGAQKRLSRAELDLVLGGAKLDARGAFGRPGDVLEVRLVAPDLAPIGRAFKVDVAGSLNLEGQFTGTFASPAGRAVIAAEKLRLPAGLSMATANGRFEVGSEASSPIAATLDVTHLARRVGNASEPVAERANVVVSGTRSQHRITLKSMLAPDRASSIVALAKEARPLDAVLQGGFVERAPIVTWKGRIESFAIAPPMGYVLAASASLTVAPGLVELGDATVKGEWGVARFEHTRWTPTRIEARGSSEGLLTRPIIRSLGLPSAPRSTLVLSASWDIRAAETLDGFIRVQRVKGDVRIGTPPLPLGLEEFTASIEATRGDVRSSLVMRGKQAGHIDLKAATQVRKTGERWELPQAAPLSGSLDADLPSIKWASDWLGPDAKLDGRLAAKLAIGGTLGEPTWRGTVAASALRMRDTSLGFDIDEGQVALALDEREVRIERFELASAWRPSARAERRLDAVEKPALGTMTAEGKLDFGTRTGSIVVRVKSYPVSQLAWRFIAASGEARLEARDGNLVLTGQLKADAGWFGIAQAAPPSLSDDVLVDRGEGPLPVRERQKMSMDLRVNLGENLYFTGRGLATRLAGDIRLRGEPGRILQATGSIRTEGGTYDAYGQSLQIERGVLSFQGPVDNPSLNVLATRQGLPVVAGVQIVGNVARPDVRLYSQPDVPDHEKLSWLVLGKGPADTGENDISTLIAAANALLGANRDNRRLQRSFGVDELRIGRGEGNSALGTLPQSTVAGRTNSARGTEVFTVGKRLTKDIYVSYQQSLAESEASLRFTYQLTQRLQLLLRAGTRPGLDLVYRWTFGD